MNFAGKPSSIALFHVGAGQSGYFTAEQAHACGYSRALLSYHAKTGRFQRIRHGPYRLEQFPSSPREHVLAAWPAVGKEIAVVSHESALELLDLSDIIPDAVHLTVPRSRRSIPGEFGVTIHTTSRPIPRFDRVTREGMVITSAARSIFDSAETGADPEQIEIAVRDAITRGLATYHEFRDGARHRSRRVASLVLGALPRVAA